MCGEGVSVVRSEMMVMKVPEGGGVKGQALAKAAKRRIHRRPPPPRRVQHVLESEVAAPFVLCRQRGVGLGV